jgi:hypothetical protein
MAPSSPGKDYCPECGGKLLYNGQGLVCIRCPFGSGKSDSSKTLPAIGNSTEDREKKS